MSPRFDIPAPPAEGIETVASVLSITNDIVFNCLVDNARIDQRALAPTREISEERLLVTNANGRYSIRGVINEVTFLPEGDKWTVRDGAISLSSNDRRSKERKIGVDRTRAIAEAEKELAALETDLKEAKKAEREVHNRRYQLKSVWNEHQKAQRKNQLKIKELERKKADIEVEMETTANTTIDTTELEEDVAQATEALEELKGKEADLKKQLEELQPGVQDARAKLDEVQTRNEKVLADMLAVEENLESCLNRMTQSETQLQKKRDRLKKYEEIVQQHSAGVDKAAEGRNKALLVARKLTLRQKVKVEQAEGTSQEATQTQDFTEEELEQVQIQETDRDSKSFEAKIKRATDKIAQERERRALSNEDPAEAMEKYFLERNNLQKIQESMEEVEKTQTELDKDLRDRSKKLKKMRKYLANKTELGFDKILSLNNSSGQVEFDEENGELNLIVQKNKDDPSSQTKDVKSLR